MKYLIEFARFIYTYCTDFTINIANILNLSYYEVNFILFCVLYPLMIFSVLSLYIIQKIRLKKLKK